MSYSKEGVKYNKYLTLYIKGDEGTNGSIRFKFTEGEEVGDIEERKYGVWNATGFRVAPHSLDLGRDLKLSSGYTYLIGKFLSGTPEEKRFLHPHIEFTDDGTKKVHTSVLRGMEVINVFTNPVSEVVGTVLGQSFTIPVRHLIKSAQHLTGSVAATAAVTYSIYHGTDNTGTLVGRFVIPLEEFTASTLVTIEFDYAQGTESGVPVYIEFVSEAPISLQTDGAGNIITIHNAQQLDELNMVTENLLIDNEANLLFNNAGELIYTDQF